jgi:two-component system, response regulator
MIDVTAEVLMVEDNIHDAELTMLALKKGGLDRYVFVVKDGAEAVDFIFAKGKYEQRQVSSKLKVIILDLKLPKLDGFEVLEKMRADKSFDTIPVVIHSSSAVEDDIKRAYELGANSYVVKPIDFAEHSRSITSAVSYWININRTI